MSARKGTTRHPGAKLPRMKHLSRIAVALALAVTASGCSQGPKDPPVETGGQMGAMPASGGGAGAGGGGGAGTSDDGGPTTSSSDDAGTDASTSACLMGACTGCCDPLNICHPGNSAAYCGSFTGAVQCQPCETGLSCVGGSCQAM